MRLLSECHASSFRLETLCLLIGHSAKYRPGCCPRDDQAAPRVVTPIGPYALWARRQNGRPAISGNQLAGSRSIRPLVDVRGDLRRAARTCTVSSAEADFRLRVSHRHEPRWDRAPRRPTQSLLYVGVVRPHGNCRCPQPGLPKPAPRRRNRPVCATARETRRPTRVCASIWSELTSKTEGGNSRKARR